MKKITKHIAAAGLLAGIWLAASAATTLPDTFGETVMSQIEQKEDGDYPVKIDGVDYIVTITDGKPSGVRMPLFDAETHKNFDDATLLFAEEAAAHKLLRIPSDKFGEVRLLNGSWNWLAEPDRDKGINISIRNSRECDVTVSTLKGDCSFTFPTGYDKVNTGTRGEVEQAFIDGMKKFRPGKRTERDFSIDDLRRVGQNVFLLEGDSYIISDVNQNCYLEAGKDGNAEFIYDPKMPAVSLANMINAGVGYCATLDMTVSKHEYGVQEKLQIPLESFIQYCISKGCRIYWGLDELSDNLVKGTIFCYNPVQSYDHVVRLEMDPTKLGDADHQIKAHASLFIPTNNVSNLFEEYKPKKEHEKIKWQ